ncbi:MAG: fluoride efflux transporter CrcB [Parvibaculaceae bacterium]|nr:fluoride efflux transporter CrcB [Parvibaculaceae bacterium]
MNPILVVAAGGALGSVARYLVGVWSMRLFGIGFPWGTLAVNLVGAFVIGLVVELSALKLQLAPETRLFIVTGILGGFTTFSAYALEVSTLMQRGNHALAALYAFGSIIAGVGAIFLAIFIVRRIYG